MEVIGPATPLCYAAAFGNLEVARYLLKSGAKVTLVDVRFFLQLRCAHALLRFECRDTAPS